MTAVMFRDSIRSTQCVMVTSEVWHVNHCDVGTVLGQVWWFFSFSLNYD